MTAAYLALGAIGAGNILPGLSLGTASNRLGKNKVHWNYFYFQTALAGVFSRLCLESYFVAGAPIDNYFLKPETTPLFQKLLGSGCSVVVVNQHWFYVQAMVPLLQQAGIKVILLLRNTRRVFYQLENPDPRARFHPLVWDAVYGVEPGDFPPGVRVVDPLVLRNPGEILSREQSRSALGAQTSKPLCLIAQNGKPEEFNNLVKTYSYLEDEGYDVKTSTTYHGGLLPMVDYLNGVDLLITGAGYNAYWEAQYFKKDVIFVPMPRQFEDQAERVERNADYVFKENGADTLARMLVEMI